MKTYHLLACVAGCALAVSQASASIQGLFNTGVNSSGNVQPLHSVEDHYAVSGVVSTALIVPECFEWVPAPAGSAWIGPNATTDPWGTAPIGAYDYILKFDLTGQDVSHAQIAGLWATDNTGEIWLNGANTGYNKSIYGFQRLDGFLIGSGFISGQNTLEFRVENVLPPDVPNPSGLLVASLIGEIGGNLSFPSIPSESAVPEPTTMIAGALLLLPFGLQGIRCFRNRKQA